MDRLLPIKDLFVVLSKKIGFMKTFFRLLAFTKPYNYIPSYLFFYSIAIVLGAVNFAFLIPLLEVLFQKTAIPTDLALPAFSVSITYFKEFFYYYFYKIILEKGRIYTLYYVCGVVVFSVFFTNMCRYLVARLLSDVRARLMQKIRNAMFDNFMNLHLNYFSNERRGELLSRVSTDVEEIDRGIVDSLNIVFKGPFTVIVYFSFLFAISVKLTIFTILFLPLSGGLVVILARKLRKVSTQTQDFLGQIMVSMEEAFLGVKIIMAFTAQHFVSQRFQKVNQNFTDAYKNMSHKRELASPLSESLGMTVISGIILYGGSLILANDSQLSAEGFIAYVVIFSQVLPALKDITNFVGMIQRALASGRRVLEIIDQKTEIFDKENALTLKEFQKNIVFDNISFGYDDRLVLKNINLEIPKGKLIALVGQSGGGKSTLADLVARFYDVKQGRILIDGIDLRDCELDSLRKKISVVTQESILFNDTIYNNILFGNPNATRQEVEQAAQIANAHQFISQLPEGYQTNIGDSGVKLSGGQRQRLSIARAVLKNPPILILDEATSALDSESEKLVQEALNSLMKNRTAIVIAHRLSTIQNADKIVVVEKGEIVEQGTHTELIAKEGGIYQKLNLMQQLSV